MKQRSVIVLADHQPESRKARCGILAAEDVNLYVAESGSQALDLVALHKPDVVILDAELPDVDGNEVFRRLKSDAGISPLIILTISASAPPCRRKAALACGADAYLLEPVEPDVFAAIVQSALKAGQRLKQADQELSDLRERLAEARGEVEQFASRACHDIEEPLRAVTTFAQLIEERRERNLSADERTYLGHVMAASTRVRNLVRGFLSYAQAGNGNRRTQLGPVNLRAAAAAAVQALRKRVDESGSVVIFEDEWPAVWGDFGQLQQVFEQVIGNAIEYRRPGSAVEVTLGAGRTNAGECEVAIADNGNGIPTDFRSSIFLPFKRLHGRETPGAGLGLAISKRIVEAHGGRIWVDSTPGTGARFCFTLRLFESETRPS